MVEVSIVNWSLKDTTVVVFFGYLIFDSFLVLTSLRGEDIGQIWRQVSLLPYLTSLP